MVSDFNTQESYQFFLLEATELLQIIEEGLLNLYNNYSLEEVYNLMRTAHSIKGGAALVGLNAIEDLAHKLESIFKLFYNTKTTINSDIESLLLDAYNCLRWPLVQQINTGKSDSQKELTRIKYLLEKITILTHQDISKEEKKENKSENKQEEKIIDDKYNDILFGDEIKEGLNRLEIILSKPNTAQALDTLKAQIKILKGLAELSEIPKFVSISKLALQALTNNPQLLTKIGNLALDGFRFACQLDKEDNSFDVINMELKALANYIKTPTLNEVNENKLNNQIPIIVNHEEENISSVNRNKVEQNFTLNSKSISHQLLPVGNRLDLIGLEKLNNLFNELIIQENNFYSHGKSQQEIILALNKWLNQFQNLVTHQNDLPKVNSKNTQNIEDNIYTLGIQIKDEFIQLKEIIEDLELLNAKVLKENKIKQKIFKQINYYLKQARMLPIGSLLKQFPRLIKELALQRNKQVKLIINGKDTLIDKLIIERLYNPLIHLLRNSIYHGIESPSVRVKKGKNKQGSITINTYNKNGKIFIEVVDDGEGIDIEKIKNVINEKKLLSPEEINNLSEQKLYEYLFKDNFSTATTINNLSGRGMGLSIVKSDILALKGEIKVTSKKDLGTIFVLEIPLSLSMVKLLIFEVNSTKFAIPFDNLTSILSVTEKEIITTEKGEVYRGKTEHIPLYPLELFFNYNYPLKNYNFSKIKTKTSQFNSEKRFPLLIISCDGNSIALKIDSIITQQELVIKPFNNLVKIPSCLSGCTMLSDGKLIPVLDDKSLINKWEESSVNNHKKLEKITNASSLLKKKKIPTILVVDDSLTIRQTLSLTLQKNGYTVIQAQDGWEALNALKNNLDIKAIISDIEMPKMNGLEFLSHYRQSQDNFLPFIILTSRSSQKHHQLAMKLGANDYLTKPYLDKDLLSIVRRNIK